MCASLHKKHLAPGTPVTPLRPPRGRSNTPRLQPRCARLLKYRPAFIGPGQVLQAVQEETARESRAGVSGVGSPVPDLRRFAILWAARSPSAVARTPLSPSVPAA